MNQNLPDACPTCGSTGHVLRFTLNDGSVCKDSWHGEKELAAAQTRAVPTIDFEKTFYLAGPMTGYPEYNYPAFEDAKRALENSGLKIVSPHEAAWPENAESMGEEQLWRLMMEATNRMLARCDGIILQKGWPRSSGCRIELQHALENGWPIYYYHDFQLIDMNKEGVN